MTKPSKEELAARYAEKNKTNNSTADQQSAGIPPREPSEEDLDAAVAEQEVGDLTRATVILKDGTEAPLSAVEVARPMSAFNPEIHAVHADTGMPKTDARGQFIRKEHDYVAPETGRRVAAPAPEVKVEPLKAVEHRVVPFAESHPYADHQIHREGEAPEYHRPTEGSKVDNK